MRTLWLALLMMSACKEQTDASPVQTEPKEHHQHTESQGNVEEKDLPTQATTSFHDHSAQHGGQVEMWGHYHAEFLVREGFYSVWITDAWRAPVTSVTEGVIIDGEQRIPLKLDSDTGALLGSRAGGDSRAVILEVPIGEEVLRSQFKIIVHE